MISKKKIINPLVSKVSQYRNLAGGCVINNSWHCRISYRLGVFEERKTYYRGFIICLKRK